MSDATQVFYLKYRDTLPVLEVVLLKPDGSVQDLTGTTGWKLHIRMSDGTRLVRTMTKYGADANGTLRYSWVASDWNAPSSPDGDGSFQVGGLVAGPEPPLARGAQENRMEFEVLGPASARLTFPNGGDNADAAYVTLRIFSDIGQG